MKSDQLTPATIITSARLFLVPLFIHMSSIDLRIAIGIFLLASLTDWLDGYVARRYQCQSELGALLDPLADKAMSWSALFVINQSIRNPYLGLASLCIVLRDLALSLKRVYHYVSNDYPNTLQVSKMAKFKTAILFMSQLLLTFYLYQHNTLVYQLGSVLLYASSLLTLISFVSYYQLTKDAGQKITRE